MFTLEGDRSIQKKKKKKKKMSVQNQQPPPNFSLGFLFCRYSLVVFAFDFLCNNGYPHFPKLRKRAVFWVCVSLSDAQLFGILFCINCALIGGGLYGEAVHIGMLHVHMATPSP